MKFKNIFSKHNKVLLLELVKTDFKLRYQGSVLGYLWSLLKPLMLFAIMYVVFIHFLRFGTGIPHFAVSLLLGIVMWTFFVEATSQGMQSVVARGDLLRKIKFSKYILVVSATISALINLILNLVIVFVFMLYDGVDFSWSALLFPLSVTLLYLLALGLAFLLSAINVRFRDISHVWEVVLQGVFYATPIIYPLQSVLNYNDLAGRLLMLNPIAVIFQNSRAQLVGSKNIITADQLFSNTFLIFTPYVLILVTIIYSLWYFRKKQARFAEQI